MRVAVIGAGVIGLSTTAALLDRGVDVTCFERLAPMGERSVGESRIFRLAHTDPQLVDLAAQSRRLFTGWEERAGERLIDPVGTVVSGETAPQWADALAQAGAEHVVVGPDSQLLRLPTRQIAPVSVIDPAGGVILLERVRAFLSSRCSSVLRIEEITALEDTASGVIVGVGETQERYDVVVLCAGARTASLAAQVGLTIPAELAHHARFTYRLRADRAERADTAGAPLQCWLTTSATGFASYQHSSGPGLWSVGGHVDDADVAWEVGAEHALRVSEQVTTDLVARTLDDVEPEVVDRLYCTVNPGLGDGVQFRRGERVLAMFGENLFKFAPLIGARLGEAVVDGSLPPTMGAP